MNTDSWTCVMVKDGPGILDEEIRAELKMWACKLHLENRKTLLIKGEDQILGGIICTDWEVHTIGTRSGILFRTEVEDRSGDYKVNFLLSDEDLRRGAKKLKKYGRIDPDDEGVWLRSREEFPLPSLYEFHDLRPSRMLH